MQERVKNGERTRRDIAGRMSLRLPQEESLRILANVLEDVPLAKDGDVAAALTLMKAAYPSVEDFERDFLSLCFALATGVGKTRLMGAFITYLYQMGYSKNFFVLAPNTTIYEKLVADFTPGTPKYVFKGIAEFVTNQPVVVTGDTWDQSALLIQAAQRNGGAIINVFNVDKINKDQGRIKKLHEYIGESYFDYLAGLPDLVLLMDEAHRYRAKAGFKAVADLRPVLGLELTATPKTVGARSVDFKNVIYRFGLREAMEHGYVKEPAVATRANFNPKDYSDEEIERIKLEDGIHAHEQVRVELAMYAADTGKPKVHPFMLVVAQDTDHAQRLREMIQSDGFFGGYYKDKVIRVDSALRGDESDEATERLLALEHDAKTEIVIHVNKLKEGWDVTNLFTIVPLRASASEILTEQTLGRGLRLPYGQRTGVEPIDRLTIIAHDRFEAIIEAAKKPDSVVQMKAVVIGPGGDVPPQGAVLVEAPTRVEAELTGKQLGGGEQAASVLERPEDRAVASATLEVIRGMERKLGGVADLSKPEVQAEIVAKVAEMTKPVQGVLEGLGAGPAPDVAKIVAKVTEHVAAGTIEIPEIVVIPDGAVSFTFRDFDLKNLDSIAYRPLADEIMVQQLRTEKKSFIAVRMRATKQERLEDFIVAELIGYPEIDYDTHADLLYKLAGQVTDRLQAYLTDGEEIERVLVSHAKKLGEFVHQQMMEHYEETPTTYRARVDKGFQVLKKQNFSQPAGQAPLDFRTAVTPKSDTRRHIFVGFKKCCYAIQQFQSDDERRFAVLIDDTASVVRWVKPGRGQFMIDYRRGQRYEPDFIVETTAEKLICEVKARNELTDTTVVTKATAARTWVGYSNEHARITGKKPWRYMLIPHDVITASVTLDGLVRSHEQPPITGPAAFNLEPA
ncbi:DEAD/DEAH box helicase [Roseomonas genomospecies 6]|uniref:Restriction endonuclease subunit R n=1 Tax=Roseomonas genomospecies 6 TaxID=214106 RepID=A0A9W7KNS0_9PROT|nr:DEAD/DEAH box helicase family protein [Roseomonas genomospecies 6]KAA0676356.1 restriction endonuclease subunit R [Roseomonas genomospecies 6]